ncbi:hypothetical protein ACH79_20265 [Bradyrhizobium sp. CCBAU 051011]|nr:hypothetical protein ACH79_20265 [Bradyrhizobium sp. CCBAU 051011]
MFNMVHSRYHSIALITAPARAIADQLAHDETALLIGMMEIGWRGYYLLRYSEFLPRKLTPLRLTMLAT